MQKLIDAGLWGEGLIVVSGEMVDRYNQCLADMGLFETALESFTIDCMGWSPEIAKERRNHDYLSHTNANRLAIILFPEQEHSPVYNPTHSFDWDLMKQWFRDHRPQIIEVTKHSGIWLDLDQDMDIYHGPDDLFLMASMTVRPWTPARLMVNARVQKSLVSRFMHQTGTPIEIVEMLMSVPGELEESVNKVGYVAHKPIVIDSMQYATPPSFFTPLFDGVFVFRSVDREREVQISLGDVVRDKGVNGPSDRKVLQILKELRLTSPELNYWKDHLRRLEIIRDSFLMEVLDRTHPNINFLSLDGVGEKAIITSKVVQEKVAKEYLQLDQVINYVRSGRLPKSVPKEIAPYLIHPVEGLGDLETEAVWHALSLVCDGRSVVQLYCYDKQKFFVEFKTWSHTRQEWVKAMIGSYYQSRMMDRRKTLSD